MDVGATCGGSTRRVAVAVVTPASRNTHTVSRANVVVPASQQATDAAIAIERKNAVSGALVAGSIHVASAATGFATRAVSN